MPKIVTANLLATGAVVFLDQAGEWDTNVDNARLFADAAATEEGLAIGQRDVERSLIVDPFVADTDPGKGELRGMTLRDAIRANGPTIDYLPTRAKVA